MKTVFVCSTIWDLEDVRAEVREFLQRNGFQSLMSEHDDFPDSLSYKSTYDKCLEAVQNCDYFMLIANNRYGGPRTLKPDEISIAHQEFREAVKIRKPFIGFVRDKLDADWQTWKRTSDLGSLSFVKTDKDTHLFNVLEEINHSAEDGNALWRQTFKDSIELKRKLACKLGINDFSNNYIAQAQMLHSLPRLTMNYSPGMGNWIEAAVPNFTVVNLGSGTAETVSASLRSQSGRALAFSRLPDLLPEKASAWKGVSIDENALKDTPLTVTLTCQNILGNAFHSEFDIHVIDRAPGQREPLIARSYFGPPRNHL